MTNTIKKTLALILSIIMLMTAMPMSFSLAAGIEVDGDYEYMLTENGVTITGYKGTDTVVEIPETLGGQTVTRIGADEVSRLMPFYENATLISVVIPDTVECIGYGAFYKCSSLETVELGDGVKVIEAGAFRNSSKLKTITIGAKVTSIEKNVFWGCGAIETVNYKGSEEQWNSITWGANNNAILANSDESFKINFNYVYDCEANGHKDITFEEAKAATCTEDGNIAYWYCGVCEAKFNDEALTIPVTDVVILAKHKTLTETVAKDADCSQTGNLAYWYCAVCDTYFADADATTKYENNEHIIAVNENHSYGDWYYIAGGKHKRICKINDNHIEIKDCSDSAADADCKCDTCSAFVAHTLSEATCSALATCSVCQETVGELNANNHKLEKFVAKDFTCTENGNLEYWYCSWCEKYFKNAEATEKYSENEWVTDAAHIIDTYVSAKEPTCKDDGNVGYWCCSVCNATFKFSNGTNPIENVVVPATGNHTYDEGKVTTEPGCTTIGTKTYTCTLEGCGATRTEDINSTGHTPGDPVKENDIPMECDKDGSYDMVVYCATCKDELSRKTEIVAHGHNIKLTFPLEYKKPANCTEPAILETWCDRCKQNIEIPVGDPLGHTEVTAPDKAATCEEDGLNGGTWCSVCKTYTVAPVVTPMLGHKWEKVSTTATCTEDGIASYVCKNDPTHTKTEAESKLGHDYSDWTIDSDPTCSATGSKTRVCSRYNECKKYETETIPAAGHVFEIVNAKPATCVDEGNAEHKYCDVCDRYFAKDASNISVDGFENADNFKIAIDKGSHKNPEPKAEVPATCLESGFEGGTYCNDCETWVSGHGVIDALGHSFNNITPAVDATCIAGGNKAFKKCDACELYFAADASYDAANGVPETTSFNTPIDSSRHINFEPKDEMPATCLESGFEGGTFCNDCETWISGHAEIPALGHEDENFDHACDNDGCDVVQGVHADANKDHACDYGCQVGIGTHEDANKDHACDYGCQVEFGTHEDANKDHVCDYGCQVEIGIHEDANKDHVCDYGCQVEIGTHEDTNKDHVCDYGCQVEIGTHEDANKDHACDYGCQVGIGTHEDANKDHACDYGCQVELGIHTDISTDDDHVCDYGCGEVLEDCVDGDDNNHNCDICDEADVSAHSFSVATCENPETCTVCGETRGTVDSDNHVGDTYTETENEVEGTCTTESSWDVVTYCDDCGEELDREAKTGSKDSDNHAWSDKITTVSNGAEKEHSRSCTRCSKTEKIGHNVTKYVVDIAATCLAAGREKAYCAYCKGDVYRVIPKLDTHTDADKNNKCDICKVTINVVPEEPKPETPGTDKEEINCACNCHKNGIMGFLFDFILFFQRLFGLNKTCDCGRAHY